MTTRRLKRRRRRSFVRSIDFFPKPEANFGTPQREPPRRSKNFLGIQFFFLQKNPTELTKFLVSSAGPPGRLPKHENGGRSRPPVVSCRSFPSAGDLGGAKPTRPSSDLVLAREKVCEAISAGPVELRPRLSRRCPRRALVGRSRRGGSSQKVVKAVSCLYLSLNFSKYLCICTRSTSRFLSLPRWRTSTCPLGRKKRKL